MSAEIEHELNRLKGARIILVLMAEKFGLAVPRSCCSHSGDTACLRCSSNWLVGHILGRTVVKRVQRAKHPICRKRCRS